MPYFGAKKKIITKEQKNVKQKKRLAFNPN